MSALVDLDKVRSGGSPWVWLDEPSTVTDHWAIDLPYAKNPIPMNGSRGSVYAHARKVKGVRLRGAGGAALVGIPPLGRCSVQLVWYVTRADRRDVENLGYTLKALCDGLVDAGVVRDDTPDLMDKPQSRIVLVDPAKNDTAWMELTVSRWAGHDETENR